ncbi:MAG TPA: hypothetical protein PK323_09465 [Bacteroidia bacterium]|nr:hypothetical protein [Bacteroidia bacterium]
MKSERNNNQLPTPEDLWPDAKVLLDRHFARKRKVFLLFGFSAALIISAIGLVFLNSKNSNKANRNKTMANTQSTNTINQPINASSVITTNPNNKALVNSNNNKLSPTVTQNNSIKSDNENHLISKENKTTDDVLVQENTDFLNEKPVLMLEMPVKMKDENMVASDFERPSSISFSKLPLPTFKMPKSKLDACINEKNHLSINENNEEYFKSKNQFHLYISAYTGLQNVNKQIKAEQSLIEYADIRNVSENKINTVYYGLNFTLEKKDLMLQSGLEYNVIGENNNYEAKSKKWLQNDEKVWDVYNKQIIKVDTIYHFGIVNYNQTIINVKDSTLLTKSDSVFVYQTDSSMLIANGKTLISFLEIPLLFGYQFKFGKLAVSPFIGVSFGYLTQAKGMYINKTITGVETIISSNVINSFNCNYQLKVQLSYQVNDKMMLTLTPGYRHNLISISPKLSGIDTKFSTLGTAVGLCYKL